MGRTLHYSILSGPDRLGKRESARILVAQALWNHGFTWSHERLAWHCPRFDWYPCWPNWRPEQSRLPNGITAPDAYALISELLGNGLSIPELERLGIVDLHQVDPHSEDPLTGFTKVRDDEWNAYLVCSFARRLSEALPGATVSVRDEGDFVLAGELFFRNGLIFIDEEEADSRLECLKGEGLAVQCAKQGVFFASIPAKDYLGRKEFADVLAKEGRDKLENLTLLELGRRIRYPGTDLLPGAPL